MALIKWDPWTDLARVREQLDEAFAGLTTRDRGSAWMPAADVAKEDGTIVIRLDLPGMQEQDVKVEIDGRQLVVSGERQDEHEETREGFYSRGAGLAHSSGASRFRPALSTSRSARNSQTASCA